MFKLKNLLNEGEMAEAAPQLKDNPDEATLSENRAKLEGLVERYGRSTFARREASQMKRALNALNKIHRLPAHLDHY